MHGSHFIVGPWTSRSPGHRSQCRRPGQKDWRQIKMMFKDEDYQVLQTLIDNHTISLSPMSPVEPLPLPSRPFNPLSRKMCIFGTIGMSCCQICTRSTTKVFTHYPLTSSPMLVRVSSHCKRSKK